MKKIALLLIVVLALSFALTSCGKNSSGGSGPITKSVTLYDAYYDNNCSSPYAKYNGSYIKIDTNPYDYDGDSSSATTYASTALSKIKAINSTLGFPEYVYDDMMSTRALDGKQTYTGKRFSASWRYHPDSGLEVTYTEN